MKLDKFEILSWFALVCTAYLVRIFADQQSQKHKSEVDQVRAVRGRCFSDFEFDMVGVELCCF